MASKRRKRRQSCGKKRKYEKNTAFRVAVAMRAKYLGERIDAYPCGQCGFWHVGHRPKKVQQKIRARRDKNGA